MKSRDEVYVRRVQIAISLCALAVAIVHSCMPKITIDAITMTLLGMAMLPWLGPLFKSVEMPGGIKVEFQDLQNVQEDFETSGLLLSAEEMKPKPKKQYSFQIVLGEDPNLALAGLRIEIESRLNDLAKQNGIKGFAGGVTRLTRELEKEEVLAQGQAEAIRELLPLLNQATHGAEVEQSAFDWAMDFGPRVLGALEDRLGEATMPQLVERWKNRDGADFQEVGDELSKAFVQSPAAFLTTMDENLKEFEDWLSSIEVHTFTMYEADSGLEGELISASYEKLRSLMLAAAKDCENTKYSELASKIENGLNEVQLRRIW